MIGEIIQLALLKLDYFNGLENYLELAILAMTWVMLYVKDMATEKSLAAWLVVCITMMILLLFEKLHLLGMSIYISMFRKISFNFIKLAILLIWMVMAFSVSFYLLIHISIKGDNETPFVSQMNNNQAGEELKNDTLNFLNAFLNTVIMSTGEFNFSNLDFKDVAASRLLFGAFLFSIFLVGMNLLNGVAIHDIQIIKHNASKYKVRDQAECIISFDILRTFVERFRKVRIDEGLIFLKCFPDKVCSLFPNRHKSTTYVKCDGYHKESLFIHG